MARSLADLLSDDDLLALIERAAKLRPLKLDDLPLANLQQHLEQNWEPEASVLLGTGLPRGGRDSVVFAAATLSATLTVAHGLGRLPLSVVATAYASPSVEQIPLCNTHNWTDTSFNINAEVDTAYTGSIQFSWIAL